jgi:maltose alpha-D-glucosyltransferase / alpha-amylase
MAATFLRHYLATVGPSPLLPGSRRDVAALLDLFLSDRAAGELREELQNRPEWTHIPLGAFVESEPDESEA